MYLKATHKLILRAWKSGHIQHCGNTWQPLFSYTLQAPSHTCALNTVAASLTLTSSVTLNIMAASLTLTTSLTVNTTAASLTLTTSVALGQPTNP